MGKRLSRAIAILLFIAAVAQDISGEVIRLKNGRVLVGTILEDEEKSEGFRFLPADKDSPIFLMWSQISAADRERLQGGGTAPDTAEADLIDGVRIITNIRIVEGVVLTENETDITLKNAQGTPIIAKSAILKRLLIKIKKLSIYTPLELLQAKESELPMKNPDSLIILGSYARELKQYNEALKYFERAVEMDPSKQAQVVQLLESLQTEMRESDAADILAEIQKLERSAKFDEAEALCAKLTDEYAETHTAKGNKGILDRIKEEGKKYRENRDKFLEQKVVERWKALISSAVGKYSSSSVTFDEAAKYVGDSMDKEIVDQIAKQFSINDQEVVAYWGKRPNQPQSAGYDSGSWIVGGGTTGSDYQGSDIPQNEIRMLQSDLEWWKSASSTTRKKWLTAYYADTSSNIKKLEKKNDTKCSQCRGEGAVPADRGGKRVNVICPRCHGVKNDITITYN